MGGYRRSGRLGPAVPIAPGARVDKFEVFFDLVFVFSFFIITRATAANISGRQLLHAALVLAVLWWIWVVHSLVATRVRLGEGYVPVLMVIAMVALFAFALGLPQAFSDPKGSAAGPMLVAISYVVVRAVHMILYQHVVRDSPQERRQLRRFAPELAVSIVLLLAAALIPAQITNPDQAAMVRDGLWITVVVVQYATGFIVGTWGWGVTSAEHWTERYDLILIIALGESIISTGVGGNLLGKPVTWPAVAAAALGIVVTAALWWAHFDFIAPAARIALHAAEGGPRVAMARDAYAYLYLLMIAGVILFSIGNEEILHKITDPAGGIAEQVEGPAVPMLFGGLICYFAVNLLFQLRTLHTVTWTRIGVIVALTVALPIGQHLPALGALTLATVICVGLVAVEVLVLSQSRHALRAAVFQERTTHEAHEAAWRARWHDVPETDEPTTP